MCGVVHTNTSETELAVAPQEAGGFMAPSITLGSDPHKAVPPTEEELQQLQQHGGAIGNKEIPTIDLAADENDDLQKAIALSLQEQGQQTPLTSVDQDFSKALEVSLKVNCPRTIDIINPHERRRQGDTPVGLKNIGNSCWFNVVIQPLFHIPAFCNMIVESHTIVESFETDMKTDSQGLIPNLRLLFSLLIASEKKYVNPSDSVNMFQGQEMRKNAQQDVCEFVHKLLEGLEDEYKMLKKRQNMEKESEGLNVMKESTFENPIMEMFYGQSKKEMCKEVGGPKLETFGQYPLTIKKYKDIHESILASMTDEASGDDENLEENTSILQDTWFKLLPPVLIFSLSRYEFSKERQRAEKVHNKFDFPECLFMDRYMESNKEIIKVKHVEISKIKHQLSSLYRTLDKYRKFGSGEGRYPLVDILKYTLEFAEVESIVSSQEENKLVVTTGTSTSTTKMEIDQTDCADDIEMSDPKETSNRSPPRRGDVARDMAFPSVSGTADSHNVDSVNCDQYSSPQKRMKISSPTPRIISREELSVLKTCLPRWQKEVSEEVIRLETSIKALEIRLEKMYEETTLQKIPYRLHAVIVHEGQAYGGHYWVYIFDIIKGCWIKFNDIQVTESSLHELLQDSVGGQNNASAYCLMYIDQSRYQNLFPDPSQSIENKLSELPVDLQDFLKNDNVNFMRELAEWETKQKQMEAEQRAIPAAAPNSPDIIYVDEDEETKFLIELQTMLCSNLNDVLMKEQCLRGDRLKQEMERIKNFAFDTEQNKLSVEPAIMDFGIYLILNAVERSELYIEWYAYEVLYHLTQSASFDGSEALGRETLTHLQEIREEYSTLIGGQYKEWKKLYRTFICCTWNFLFAFRSLKENDSNIALNCSLRAIELHMLIEKNELPGSRKTLKPDVMECLFQLALHTVNKQLINAFREANSENKCMDIEQAVTNLIVPALSFLTNSNSDEDKRILNEIRNCWCDLLDHCLGSQFKSRLIERIMEQVFNGGHEEPKVPAIKIPPNPTSLVLYQEYRQTSEHLLTPLNNSISQNCDL